MLASLIRIRRCNVYVKIIVTTRLISIMYSSGRVNDVVSADDRYITARKVEPDPHSPFHGDNTLILCLYRVCTLHTYREQ